MAAEGEKKMITLKSSDGEEFEVEEAVAMESQFEPPCRTGPPAAATSPPPGRAGREPPPGLTRCSAPAQPPTWPSALPEEQEPPDTAPRGCQPPPGRRAAPALRPPPRARLSAASPHRKGHGGSGEGESGSAPPQADPEGAAGFRRFFVVRRPASEEKLANARFGGTRWGGAGGGPRGSDEPRHTGSNREDFGPSRADKADDWGAGKKPTERRERMGGFGGDSSPYHSNCAGPSNPPAPSRSSPSNKERQPKVHVAS